MPELPAVEIYINYLTIKILQKLMEVLAIPTLNIKSKTNKVEGKAR
jgi:hypothetical protein